eukprot:g28911.t1
MLVLLARQIGEKPISILDCSGNSRAAHLVKERFGRSVWVFIVYDLAKKESLDYALALILEVHAAGARALLFGNKYNPNGLKKVIQDFPKLKFHGKGHEFEDLKVLMAAYKKWLKDLYPFKDDFEDLIWKARDVLQQKETTESGESDPKQHLHLLRFHYKCGKEGATKTKQDEEFVDFEDDAFGFGFGFEEREPKMQAEDHGLETAKRVAENRAKALERKRCSLQSLQSSTRVSLLCFDPRQREVTSA